MGAQDFVSFGYRSQSRETMEYSAKSECDGAFERRRETSPLPPREPNSPVVKQDKYEQDMDEMKTAQGDLAAKLIEIQRQQEEFAATLKAVTGIKGSLWILWNYLINKDKAPSEPAIIIIMERIRMDWRRNKRRARRSEPRLRIRRRPRD